MKRPTTPDSGPFRVELNGRREAEPSASRRAVALEWGLGGLLAAPFAVLPHELGHYVVLLLLGVPGLALHYSTVTWDLQEFWGAIQRGDLDGAAAVAPIWGVALSDAVGPAVTYAIVAACCYGCSRWRAHPSLVAIAFLAQARIAVGVIHVAREALDMYRPTNYDELRFSILTGVPVEVFVAFGLVVLLVSTRLHHLAGALLPSRQSNRGSRFHDRRDGRQPVPLRSCVRPLAAALTRPGVLPATGCPPFQDLPTSSRQRPG